MYDITCQHSPDYQTVTGKNMKFNNEFQYESRYLSTDGSDIKDHDTTLHLPPHQLLTEGPCLSSTVTSVLPQDLCTYCSLCQHCPTSIPLPNSLRGWLFLILICNSSRDAFPDHHCQSPHAIPIFPSLHLVQIIVLCLLAYFLA